MSSSKESGLEGAIEEKKTQSHGKARLVLMSELELATKLSDPEVLKGVANVVKRYTDHIDAIVINGGLAQVPDRYSRRRGERLDLLEDRLKEVYGEQVYKEVKQDASGSDSIDSFEEAIRLARVQMRPLYQQAVAKSIPVYYIFSENDYNNVANIISALEKAGAAEVRKSQSKQKSEKAAESNEADEEDTKIRGIDPSLVAFIKRSYNITASQWKNKDKQGVKDVALSLYKQWVSSIFSDENGVGAKVKIIETAETKDKQRVQTMKWFENEIDVNGVRIRAMHAINGLYAGNNEGKPTERGVIMAVRNANIDAQHNRLPDIYLRAHESATNFTAIDYKSREGKPVYLINCGPLQNLDAQIRKHAGWNKTTEAKRVDQPEDSAMMIVSVDEDCRLEIQHIGFRALKQDLDVSKLEERAKSDLIEAVQISDFHIGAASTERAYEQMEAIAADVTKSKVDKKNRYLLMLGDMLHGGADKATHTDVLWPQREGHNEVINSYEKAKNLDDLLETTKEVVYGVAFPDLGDQVAHSIDYIVPIAKEFDHAFTVDGNHTQKAAGNASESGMLMPVLMLAGIQDVIRADRKELAHKQVRLGPYAIHIEHSPGYRGGVDAGSAMRNKVLNTGRDDVDIAAAGDCHEAHLDVIAKRGQFGWSSLVTITAPAVQDKTSFESKIIAKGEYTRGYSTLYVPTDVAVGTSYFRYVFVPKCALLETLKKNGGSRLEKAIKRSANVAHK